MIFILQQHIIFVTVLIENNYLLLKILKILYSNILHKLNLLDQFINHCQK